MDERKAKMVIESLGKIADQVGEPVSICIGFENECFVVSDCDYRRQLTPTRVKIYHGMNLALCDHFVKQSRPNFGKK